MSENMEKVYDVIVVGSGLRGLRRHCTAPARATRRWCWKNISPAVKW